MTTSKNIQFPKPKPPVRFGVKVSETHPDFDMGEYKFQTLLIGLNEDRHLSKQQAQFPKAALKDDGSDGELTEEQQEETVNLMAKLVAGLLRKRLLVPSTKATENEPDTFALATREFAEKTITTDWVLEYMTSADFGPFMYFLRQGHPQDFYDDDRDTELDDLGDTDPNAEQ